METSHYMIEYNHFDHPPQGKFEPFREQKLLNCIVRTPGARKFYHTLKKEFGTLAFCRRWIDRLGETRYLGHLKVSFILFYYWIVNNINYSNCAMPAGWTRTRPCATLRAVSPHSMSIRSWWDRHARRWCPRVTIIEWSCIPNERIKRMKQTQSKYKDWL